MKTPPETRPATNSVTQSGDGLGARDASQAQLFLVLERARPLAGGTRHSLANIDRVTLGRGPLRAAQRVVREGIRTLVLTVPDERLSSAHGALERSGAAWIYADRASTNGSRINRKRVDRAPLADGDLLELGQTFFRFRAATPTPANALGDAAFGTDGGVFPTFPTLLPWLARDLETVARVARSDVSLLLLGETGTGKEVLARAVHAQSGRVGPFVAVNCGALAPTLVESLLFGHKKGAFSGAAQDEVGLVRAADGGTLFLDEVGELAPASQAALLRVLQEREVVPVGATRPVPVDLRVVAATHRPLGALVESGGFRSDLYARLSAFVFEIPPLRERLEDVGSLAATLLRRVAGARADALTLTHASALALLESAWPLNVRQLEQCLKVGALLAEDGRIELAMPEARAAVDRPSRPADSRPAEPRPGDSRPVIRPAQTRVSAEDQALRAELVLRLTEHRGNVTRVGEAMGRARTQIQRWMRRLQIDPRDYQ